MKIVCNNTAEWLITLHSKYNSSRITLNESDLAFTAVYNPTPNRNMMVARFDKVGGSGYVICRRKGSIIPEVEKRH